MTQWWIGCSGFHYKHWKEVFYPKGLPQTKWFDFYCQYFNTLELNVTFYRFPQVRMLEGWYNKSPQQFLFSVKAPRIITHFKKFLGVERFVEEFYATIREGLKEKLGVALFQLPPVFSYTEARLQAIITNLNPEFINVVEFRHSSWWNAGVYNELAKHNIMFCGMSHPAFPQDIIQNTKELYYRFHGVPALYASPYEEAELVRFCEAVNNSGITNRAFAYFNNDIGGSAIGNAIFMKKHCEQTSPLPVII
jgi:uncharacterized protein YecE (DUF72 family)